MTMQGRSTPGSRPMRNSAEAMVAPVLPAETIALAFPSRTSSAARTKDESFFFRTLDAGIVVHGDDFAAGDDLETQGVAHAVRARQRG